MWKTQTNKMEVDMLSEQQIPNLHSQFVKIVVNSLFTLTHLDKSVAYALGPMLISVCAAVSLLSVPALLWLV